MPAHTMAPRSGSKLSHSRPSIGSLTHADATPCCGRWRCSRPGTTAWREARAHTTHKLGPRPGGGTPTGPCARRGAAGACCEAPPPPKWAAPRQAACSARALVYTRTPVPIKRQRGGAERRRRGGAGWAGQLTHAHTRPRRRAHLLARSGVRGGRILTGRARRERGEAGALAPGGVTLSFPGGRGADPAGTPKGRAAHALAQRRRARRGAAATLLHADAAGAAGYSPARARREHNDTTRRDERRRCAQAVERNARTHAAGLAVVSKRPIPVPFRPARAPNSGAAGLQGCVAMSERQKGRWPSDVAEGTKTQRRGETPARGPACAAAACCRGCRLLPG